jgi:deferrochelatase/peroxidase EfeB
MVAESGGVSRRQLIGASAGAALVGALGGAYAGRATAATPEQPAAVPAASGASGVVEFHGAHQAGIITPAQDRLHFVSLDVLTKDPDALRGLLDKWTEAAARMTRGEETVPGGFDGGGQQAPPDDTGEAFELPASQLTVTIGYAPGLFDARFGLASRRPEALTDLPAFRGDALEPGRTGGDIAIQACANDPQVAVHAVRNLIRIGSGLVAVRWSQLGFGRTSSTSTTQATPRNLFGFKDGTNNIKAEDTAALDEHVWIQPGDVSGPAAWLAGGSYLVARRIRMHIEVWDRTPLAEQEDIFGRIKRTGAAYGQAGEFDAADFNQQSTRGGPLIPETAHIRLASSHQLGGVKILRRGYNFTDGSDGLGHLDAGLFFLAYMRDPAKQFVPMQRSLASADILNEYIEHTGSGVYVCPPGVTAGQGWGSALFG